MDNIVVLLTKERGTREWSYLIDSTRYYVATDGNLLEQTVGVITALRETHNLYNANVSICSTYFVESIFYDLTLIFPTMKLIPIVDADIARIFKKVVARSTTAGTRTKQGDTLFVCSDASKGAKGNLCGWAWFSSAAGQKSYNFGVSEQHSIVEAEFEGILHAIIDNGNTSHNTIHVYCDSQRSVEFAQALLAGKLKSIKSATSKRIMALADAAVEVAVRKNVKVQWVRGHRSHRLNVGADYLSRQARFASERQGRLDPQDREIRAVMSLFP